MDPDPAARRRPGPSMTGSPPAGGSIGRYPDLAGRTAVVTGAAKGIGESIARRLVCEGMNLVAADKDRESLDHTVRAFEGLGAAVEAVCADLTQEAAVDTVFDITLERFGTIDVLVNNAADLQRRSALEEHRALLDLQLATNVRSPYLCSQRAAAAMSEAGGGSIVLVSSVGADRAHQYGLPYDMTKGAINALTRALAVDLGPRGIRVNAVGPGVTRTYRWPPEDIAKGPPEVVTQIPLRRPGTVDDIASAVAFLASGEAGYITGQVLYVDGGITAQLSPPGPLAL
ncbi:MAG: glucose 1-dehydrogenase [Acidimicrobiaceae bacterium]|nr:glucose 1-dehydrogenase [Acidimicrobiaceae bacterium]MYI15711.1 glucose 1-dehydrogenase [Acidimicrobiaceae bacterium]